MVAGARNRFYIQLKTRNVKKYLQSFDGLYRAVGIPTAKTNVSYQPQQNQNIDTYSLLNKH